MLCFQSNYHNYFPGDAKVISKDIIPHVPGIYIVKFGENFISARAHNASRSSHSTPFVPVLPIFSRRKKNRHSATSLSVKFDAETQDARGYYAPFTALCTRKNGAASWRAAEVLSSSIDRTLSVSCVYTSPGAVEVSWAIPLPPLPVVTSPWCVHPRRFRAYWEYNTFSPSALTLPPTQVASSFAAGISKILF